LQEIRLIYTFENWMSLIINLNVTFGNVIVQSGLPLKEGLLQANRDLGSFFAEELKRLHFKSGKQESDAVQDLCLVLDQLTRFQLDSISIVKEVLNKVSNLVTKRDQMLSILHFITRLEVSPDPKIVEKLAKGVMGGIDKLTYSQIGTFLESLLSLDYKVTPEFSTKII